MAVPILQSLLLADHVYRDHATGKHVICGIFSTIYFTPNQQPAAPQQPGHSGAAPEQAGNGNGHGPTGGPGGAGVPRSPGQDPPQKQQSIQSLIQAGSPYVYFSVTELTGRKAFELRYVDLHSNQSLFQMEVTLESDDPLKTIEVTLPLPRLPLVALEERSYALEVLCEGQLLGSHRVLARITKGSAPPPKNN